MDLRQHFPLVGIRIEVFINEHAVSFASSHTLQWQGYKIAQSSFRQGVLVWKETVV